MGRRDRYYTILGLNPGAADDEVKRAYRTQAMRWHPDKNSAANARAMFQEISNAFLVLSQPKDDDSDSDTEDGATGATHSGRHHDDGPGYRIPEEALFHMFSHMFENGGPETTSVVMGPVCPPPATHGHGHGNHGHSHGGVPVIHSHTRIHANGDTHTHIHAHHSHTHAHPVHTHSHSHGTLATSGASSSSSSSSSAAPNSHGGNAAPAAGPARDGADGFFHSFGPARPPNIPVSTGGGGSNSYQSYQYGDECGCDKCRSRGWGIRPGFRPNRTAPFGGGRGAAAIGGTDKKKKKPTAATRAAEAAATSTVDSSTTGDPKAPSVPATMAAPTVKTGDRCLDVAWVNPNKKEGSGCRVKYYQVEMREVAKSSGAAAAAASSSGTPSTRDYTIIYQGPWKAYTVPDLQCGTSYQLRVRAVNQEGAGDWSTGHTVTTPGKRIDGMIHPPFLNNIELTARKEKERKVEADRVAAEAREAAEIAKKKAAEAKKLKKEADDKKRAEDMLIAAEQKRRDDEAARVKRIADVAEAERLKREAAKEALRIAERQAKERAEQKEKDDALAKEKAAAAAIAAEKKKVAAAAAAKLAAEQKAKADAAAAEKAAKLAADKAAAEAAAKEKAAIAAAKLAASVTAPPFRSAKQPLYVVVPPPGLSKSAKQPIVIPSPAAIVPDRAIPARILPSLVPALPARVSSSHSDEDEPLRFSMEQVQGNDSDPSLSSPNNNHFGGFPSSSSDAYARLDDEAHQQHAAVVQRMLHSFEMARAAFIARAMASHGLTSALHTVTAPVNNNGRAHDEDSHNDDDVIIGHNDNPLGSQQPSLSTPSSLTNNNNLKSGPITIPSGAFGSAVFAPPPLLPSFGRPSTSSTISSSSPSSSTSLSSSSGVTSSAFPGLFSGPFSLSPPLTENLSTGSTSSARRPGTGGGTIAAGTIASGKESPSSAAMPIIAASLAASSSLSALSNEFVPQETTPPTLIDDIDEQHEDFNNNNGAEYDENNIDDWNQPMDATWASSTTGSTGGTYWNKDSSSGLSSDNRSLVEQQQHSDLYTDATAYRSLNYGNDDAKGSGTHSGSRYSSRNQPAYDSSQDASQDNNAKPARTYGGRMPRGGARASSTTSPSSSSTTTNGGRNGIGRGGRQARGGRQQRAATSSTNSVVDDPTSTLIPAGGRGGSRAALLAAAAAATQSSSSSSSASSTSSRITHHNEPASSFRRNYCQLCSLQLSSPVSYKQHLQSSAHRANQSKQQQQQTVTETEPVEEPETPTESDDVVLPARKRALPGHTSRGGGKSSSATSSSLAGAPPSVLSLAALNVDPTNGTINDGTHCGVCDVPIANTSQMHSHQQGRRHRLQMRALRRAQRHQHSQRPSSNGSDDESLDDVTDDDDNEEEDDDTNNDSGDERPSAGRRRPLPSASIPPHQRTTMTSALTVPKGRRSTGSASPNSPLSAPSSPPSSPLDGSNKSRQRCRRGPRCRKDGCAFHHITPVGSATGATTAAGDTATTTADDDDQ